jgi:methylated-DNA-[protein]-cysteine S-methyltransferase
MLKFSQRCYKILKKVPRGKITTYKALANALGTKAYRAVGTVLNKNPYSFSGGGDVPCHRVIKSNGEVGGFFSGTKEKIKILQREGIPIKQEKVIDVEKYLCKF